MKMKDFEVTAGKIVVSDPCYEQGELGVRALNGRWTAVPRRSDEGIWGSRVASVLVHHEGFDPIGRVYSERVEYIGVDSGQAGVFDARSYGPDHEAFYEGCCRATDKGCGFVPGGFVTSSGYGDGGYPAKVYRRDGRAEAVEITFIRK